MGIWLLSARLLKSQGMATHSYAQVPGDVHIHMCSSPRGWPHTHVLIGSSMDNTINNDKTDEVWGGVSEDMLKPANWTKLPRCALSKDQAEKRTYWKKSKWSLH